MKDQIDLLRALMDLAPPVHVFGGLAEDALLHGRRTRPHEDVDVLVYRDELPLRLDQARALGFRHFHLRMESRPGVPLVVGSVEGDLNLEYVIFDRTPEGRVWFEVPVPAGTSRVWLPDGALAHAPTPLEGVAVRTVSPLALYQIRAGVAETFGGFRPKDRVAQAALRKAFFAGVPEEQLAPRTELRPPAPLRAPGAAPSPARRPRSR